MHLWPSERLRDSFKLNYLKNIEWNLQRMNSDKNKKKNNGSSPENSNQEKLLADGNNSNKDQPHSRALAVLEELVLIFSCCYCCHCCGACGSSEDDG